LIFDLFFRIGIVRGKILSWGSSNTSSYQEDASIIKAALVISRRKKREVLAKLQQ